MLPFMLFAFHSNRAAAVRSKLSTKRGGVLQAVRVCICAAHCIGNVELDSIGTNSKT